MCYPTQYTLSYIHEVTSPLYVITYDSGGCGVPNGIFFFKTVDTYTDSNVLYASFTRGTTAVCVCVCAEHGNQTKTKFKQVYPAKKKVRQRNDRKLVFERRVCECDDIVRVRHIMYMCTHTPNKHAETVVEITTTKKTTLIGKMYTV